MKGLVFTLDAIIAMLIMASVISLLIFFRIESSSPFFTAEQLHFISEDSLNILSESTFREVGNQTILADPNLFNEYYNQSGILSQSDLDKKAIDVLGMLWAENNTNASLGAKNITKDILGNMLPDNLGYQILINDYDIYNSSDTLRPSESDAEAGISSGRIASGYGSNMTVSGCVALAYLSSIRGKKDFSYVYFGGYVGDGNITTNITLPSNSTVLETYMEMDAGSNFTLYVNGNFSGSYIKDSAGGGNMTADKWVVCNLTYNPSYCKNFTTDENKLQINFTNLSYIGGGYFRVTYNTTELAPNESLGYQRDYLPGINGIVNLYDSMYVPGNLTTMNIFLHFNASKSIFMDIGNTTVYYNNTSSSVYGNFLIPNSSLFVNFSASNVSYADLSQKTIPIRVGFKNISYMLGQNAYIISVADLSGGVSSARAPGCGNDGLCAVQKANRLLVDTLLGLNGTYVGLVGIWQGGVYSPYSHPLSTNKTSLNATINGWSNQGSNDLCTGIKNATDTLRAVGTGDDFKEIVLLGAKNPVACAGGPSGNVWNDTYNLACAAWKNYGIRISTVGIIGGSADDAKLDTLLGNISLCANGTYYKNNATNDIVSAYNNTVNDIIKIMYYLQTAYTSSNFYSVLYPDSYIEFNYTPLNIPYEYGEISLTLEGARLGSFSNNTTVPPAQCMQGWYNFSPYVTVTDAKMTSYSSRYWTDRLLVNTSNTSWIWKTVYNLSDFPYNNTINYLTLGDPYIVEIPANLITHGNNSVCIGTAVYNAYDPKGGSPDDRLIYTIRVKNSVPYGNLNDTCNGATKDATERLTKMLNDAVGGYVDFNSYNIENYTSTISKVPYMWGPANIRIRVWS